MSRSWVSTLDIVFVTTALISDQFFSIQELFLLYQPVQIHINIIEYIKAKYRSTCLSVNLISNITDQVSQHSRFSNEVSANKSLVHAKITFVVQKLRSRSRKILPQKSYTSDSQESFKGTT